MEWNNGKERTAFEREQAKKRKDYLAAGMTEEQIQSLYEYDLAWYRSQRREARHTQRLNITAFDENDGDDEAQNPLIKKFLHNFSVEDKHFETERFGWIEQIADKDLYEVIKSLSDSDKEILSLFIIDGFNVTQVAKQLNGKVYTDRKEGGKALTDALYASKPETVIAEYCGFKISMNPMTMLTGERDITLTANGQYVIGIGESASGNLTRLDNFLEDFPKRKERLENKLKQLKDDLAIAEEQLQKPFEHKAYLSELLSEQAELNAELNGTRYKTKL